MNIFVIVMLFVFAVSINAHPLDKTDYIPDNTSVTFSPKESPTVLIDQAHYNLHTMDGGYQAFAKILQSDGYSVKKNTAKFSKTSLASTDILVIVNALHKDNATDWDLPNFSAFEREEIEAIYYWVQNGGSLFLISDHMPFPKASADLAAIFGFQLNNGYAKDPTNQKSIFAHALGGLMDHPIRQGMNKAEIITSIRTFTGQAFLPPPNAKPLLVFGRNATSYMPSESWMFEPGDDTPQLSVNGWSQGATLEFDKGRVIVLGEAAMFTASKREKTELNAGFIAPGAEQNEQFLLNIMHWLSNKI